LAIDRAHAPARLRAVCRSRALRSGKIPPGFVSAAPTALTCRRVRWTWMPDDILKRLTAYTHRCLGRGGRIQDAEDIAMQAITRVMDPEYRDWDPAEGPLLWHLQSEVNGISGSRSGSSSPPPLGSGRAAGHTSLPSLILPHAHGASENVTGAHPGPALSARRSWCVSSAARSPHDSTIRSPRVQSSTPRNRVMVSAPSVGSALMADRAASSSSSASCGPNSSESWCDRDSSTTLGRLARRRIGSGSRPTEQPVIDVGTAKHALTHRTNAARDWKQPCEDSSVD